MTMKRMLRVAPLLLLSLGCGGAGEHGHHGLHHDFSDVARWAREFEDPSRAAWQKPDEVVAALSLAPGAAVADIGAGSGYFAVRFARVVGPSGRVFAVEIEPAWIGYLQERAVREGFLNLIPVLGAPGEARLHPGSIDLAFVCDTYHHIEDRAGYFRRLRSALRPGGRVAIVDFKPGDLPVGPPPAARVPIERVVEEMATAGFVRLPAPDLLPYQYLALFRAADSP